MTAACDTQILGHFIPRGTEIALHLGHAGVYDTVANDIAGAKFHSVRGHDSKKKTGCWIDNGVTFNPDRWIDQKGQFNSKAGLTLPFGGGPRLCLGHKLAVRRRLFQHKRGVLFSPRYCKCVFSSLLWALASSSNLPRIQNWTAGK